MIRRGSIRGPLLLLIDNGPDNAHVHRALADPGNLGRDTRPVDKGSTVAGKARAGGGPLGIVVSCCRVAIEKFARIFAAEASEFTPPFQPS